MFAAGPIQQYTECGITDSKIMLYEATILKKDGHQEVIGCIAAFQSAYQKTKYGGETLDQMHSVSNAISEDTLSGEHFTVQIRQEQQTKKC